MTLAADAPAPQVRSESSRYLRVLARRLPPVARDDESRSARAHRQLLVDDITRFLNRPYDAKEPPVGPTVPPGAPI